MSELQTLGKIRDIDLFGKKYEIDVIKSLNENEFGSTAYIDGRTHFAKSNYFILPTELSDGSKETSISTSGTMKSFYVG